MRILPLLAIVAVAGLAVGVGGVITHHLLTSGLDSDRANSDGLEIDGATKPPQDEIEEQIRATGERPGLEGREGAVATPDDDPVVGGDDEIEDVEVVTGAEIEDRVITDAPGEPRLVDGEALEHPWPEEPGYDIHAPPRGQRAERLDAVSRALYWLKAHQAPDGSWKAADFSSWCKDERVEHVVYADAGTASRDVSVTGLVLCAYLGAGYTNRGKSPFARTVSKGLRYLKNVQDPDGCFGPRTDSLFLMDHAFAALAMTEAFAMTESPIFKGSAQRALDFIAKARNPHSGWGFGIRDGATNTLATGFLMFPIKSAQLMNKNFVDRGREPRLVVDQDAFDGVMEWIDSVTDFKTGRVGYAVYGDDLSRPDELPRRFPADASRITTATGYIARLFTGRDPRKSDVMKQGMNEIASRVPVWDPEGGTIDAVYWWLGSLAAFQNGGRQWKAWRETFDDAIVETQRMDATFCAGRGSWDPAGIWGEQLGRVGTTALLTLCLEVYYRYDRVFGAR